MTFEPIEFTPAPVHARASVEIDGVTYYVTPTTYGEGGTPLSKENLDILQSRINTALNASTQTAECLALITNTSVTNMGGTPQVMSLAIEDTLRVDQDYYIVGTNKITFQQGGLFNIFANIHTSISNTATKYRQFIEVRLLDASNNVIRQYRGVDTESVYSDPTIMLNATIAVQEWQSIQVYFYSNVGCNLTDIAGTNKNRVEIYKISDYTA